MAGGGRREPDADYDRTGWCGEGKTHPVYRQWLRVCGVRKGGGVRSPRVTQSCGHGPRGGAVRVEGGAAATPRAPCCFCSFFLFLFFPASPRRSSLLSGLLLPLLSPPSRQPRAAVTTVVSQYVSKMADATTRADRRRPCAATAESKASTPLPLFLRKEYAVAPPCPAASQKRKAVATGGGGARRPASTAALPQHASRAREGTPHAECHPNNPPSAPVIGRARAAASPPPHTATGGTTQSDKQQRGRRVHTPQNQNRFGCAPLASRLCRPPLHPTPTPPHPHPPPKT